MKIEKIAFISAELPYWNLVTHAVFPEYGMPLIATIVRDAGYDVCAFVEHIGAIKWDNVMEADLVCFHAFSSTMPKTIEYIKRVREKRPEMPVIIGGTHGSVMPEDTLHYCDAVVRQEGDETLLELLDRWKNDESLDGVLGVSYWEGGRTHHNPNRPFTQEFETIPDLELISGYMDWPWWKLIWYKKMRWQILQTTRGCPYDCSFCIAPRELGRGYRMRSIDSVIDDIKYQKGWWAPSTSSSWTTTSPCAVTAPRNCCSALSTRTSSGSASASAAWRLPGMRRFLPSSRRLK